MTLSERFAQLIIAQIELEDKFLPLIKNYDMECSGGTYWTEPIIYEDEMDSRLKAAQNRIDDDTETINKQCHKLGLLRLAGQAVIDATDSDTRELAIDRLRYALEEE